MRHGSVVPGHALGAAQQEAMKAAHELEVVQDELLKRGNMVIAGAEPSMSARETDAAQRKVAAALKRSQAANRHLSRLYLRRCGGIIRAARASSVKRRSRR